MDCYPDMYIMKTDSDGNIEGYYYKWSSDTGWSYTELESMGLSRDLVDGYIAGQKALADNDVATIHNVVGGQDNYANLLDWSAKNLSQTEKDAFNDTIDNGSTEQVKQAVTGLMARAGMSPDNPQQSLFEGDTENVCLLYTSDAADE